MLNPSTHAEVRTGIASQFSIRLCALAVKVICCRFREVNGRKNWNGYLKLTATPHCGALPGSFRTTERQTQTLLADAEQELGGAGGLGHSTGAVAGGFAEI